jgi:glycosyltransferase involved in cell wall biosynthesis
VKILIPILSFGKEGGYRVLSKLANEFITNGASVDFLVPYFSSFPYHPTNAGIIWIDKKGRLNRIKPESRDRIVVRKGILLMWKGLKNIDNYDVILANHSLTTFPIYLRGLAAKTFYYIQAYEPEFFEELPGVRNRFVEYISKMSYNLPFTKIVNSNIYRNYKEISASKVVFPGLDLELYHPKNFQQPLNGKIKIGTIARREPHKGTAYIIDAFKKIYNQRKDVELHLAFGEASLENKVENIFVCSPDGDENLAAFYRNLDVYICAVAGQHGAIHYPVLETMASATSLLTTDYYPANNQNAYMLTPSDSDSIADAFILLCNDEQKRLAKIKQGLEDVQQFSWQKVAKKMLSILESIKQNNN